MSAGAPTPSPRGLASALGAVVLALVSLEAAGQLHNRVFLGRDAEAWRGERAAFAAQLPGAEVTASAETVVGGRPRELHPYFGYTAKRRSEGVNNHGFVEAVDYPYRAAPGERVVGLFGGSVAHQLAIDPRSRASLEEAVRQASGAERVRLLSFANGGWRQPQIFFAFTTYLDGLDGVIVLDGYNEIAQLSEQNVLTWPANFPWRSVYAHFADPAFAPSQWTEVAKMLDLARRARRWTLWLDAPGLSSSGFAHSLWRIRARRLGAEIRACREALEHSALAGDRGASLAATDAAAARRRIDDYFALYARLSRWQAWLARESGVAYAHFIQPNQYVRGAKPHSARERSEALSLGETWVEHVTDSYERLAGIVAGLRGEGVPVHDLRDVFAAETGTVYQDACCHLNDRGREALAAAIAERIGGADDAGWRHLGVAQQAVAHARIPSGSRSGGR